MRHLAPLATSLTLLGLMTTGAGAVTLVVNTTADPGAGGCNAAECTLREAIDQANTVNNTTVAFKIPTSDPGFAGGVFTIKPTSALPDLIGANGTIIDGTTEAVFLGSDPNPNGPDIVLNGALAGAGVHGLFIHFPSDCTIKGLVINRFSGDGVRIFTEIGIHNSVLGCYIGTNPTGTAAAPNGGDGVHILSSAASNFIGGTNPGDGNLISGNDGYGIEITGSSDNLVQGNRIGTDRTGAVAIANKKDGVFITGNASGNTVGGTTLAARNLISGNGQVGLNIFTASNNSVLGNYIGTNAAGTVPLINAIDGVHISAEFPNGLAQNNTIGGTVAGARNLLVGDMGVLISGGGSFGHVTGNLVQGNYIGTDKDGAASLYNAGYAGVNLCCGAENNTVGGTSVTARNVISGNGSVGVRLGGAKSNKVLGNYIGTNAAGTAAVGNGKSAQVNGRGPGVLIEADAQSNTIGGNSRGTANVIAGNGGDGVEIMHLNVSNNLVQGNLIGLNAAASAGLPNGLNGVHLHHGASLNRIGGTGAGAGNRIAFNQRDGVLVEDDGDLLTGDLIVGNRIYKNGGLGINLQPAGEAPSTVTPNDSGDPDNGPNKLQNFPVLTVPIAAGGNTVIDGTFNSLSSTQFFIDFYSSTVSDPSGAGEGEFYLGRVTTTTNGIGFATFSFTFAGNLAGQFITATATDPSNNTSEFCKARLAVPKLSVDDVRAIEGNSGTTNLTFTLTLSAASTQTVTVDVQTANGSAVAPDDYTALPLGTRSFAPGTTSKTVTVAVKGDLLSEADETFRLVLSNAANASIADGLGTGFILNDDPPPSLSIDDVASLEGNNGATGFSFTVKLSTVSGQPVKVDFATANGSAATPNDYNGVAGTLTIPAGTLSKAITVPVFGETLVEPDETFFVNLSNAVHATIADNQGKGTILNDDTSE